MSKTAAIALTPSAGLFSRLLASIDRVLMTNAEIDDPQRRSALFRL